MGKDSGQIPDRAGTRTGITNINEDSGLILDRARSRTRMTFWGQIYALLKLLICLMRVIF